MESSLFENTYNPDVLTCLANLSNDEVFTPPSVVNDMLDMLPQELFSDPSVKFLDPVCKSGVFLREIAKRLIKGLEKRIPDLQERLDHIYREQLFGIAITELTSLMSRRSLYCSKAPNRKYSVVHFKDIQGNIRFKAMEHRFQKGRCVYCGASETAFAKKERGAGMESHAYEFIHTIKPEELWNMKFDVIVGNPPYHLSDGSGLGSGAIPIYDKFIEQAIKLNPRFLTMIIPARWYSGGRGLDKFRENMLQDIRIRVIHDFPNSGDCFSGVQIEGGVCYFLWDRDHRGLCKVSTHIGNSPVAVEERPLLEEGVDSFIRNGVQVSILKKVRALAEKSFMGIVSANDPFGYDVRVNGSFKRVKPSFSLKKQEGLSEFYYFGWQKDGIGFIDKTTARKGLEFVDKWKVFITQAYGMGNSFPTQVINRPFIGAPNSLCTETYILIGPFESEEKAKNVCSYMNTRFFRFMVLYKKNTQHATQGVYQFVPMQDFTHPWNDQMLYEKYGISKNEIAFIDSLVKPME